MSSLYPSSGSSIRTDVNVFVEEAYAADSFFIGPSVMPPLGVEAKSGTYPKIQIAAGALMDNIASVRNPGGSYGEVTRAYTSDTYDCLDRGLEEPVDDTTQRDLARYFNYEVSAANWVRRNVQLAHEVRVAAEIMSTSNFGAGTNSVVAYTAANLATIDLAQDILAAIERVANNGARPNTIVMSSNVYQRVRIATKTVSWVRGSNVGQLQSPLNAAALAASFADEGIEQVLVGRARYNSAKKGQSKSMASVWGDTYIWVGHANRGARISQDGGAGFTFYWNAEGGLFVTETYRNETRRSNMVRVRQNTAEKVTDGTAGTLITTQYS